MARSKICQFGVDSRIDVFPRAKEERLLLKIKKNRRHSWTGHTVRHNEFVVNILKEQYPENRPWEDLDYNIKQVAKNTEADSCTAVKKWLAIIADGKLAINQKTEG